MIPQALCRRRGRAARGGLRALSQQHASFSPRAGLPTGFAALALLAQTAWAGADRPNILVITVDDQTAHFTSAFRPAGPDTTPNLRALAARGVRFSDGIVQAAQCGPSRNSMITGRYPHQLGFYGNEDREFIPKSIRGFPESLQRAGYYTGFIGKSHLTPDETGVRGTPGVERTRGMIRQFGFDEVAQHPGRYRSRGRAWSLLERLAAGEPWPYGDSPYLDHLYERGLLWNFIADGGRVTTLPNDDYLEGFVARSAADWITRYDGARPFFLHVNFGAPHQPYDQPAAFQDLYRDADLPRLVEDPDLSDIPAVMKSNAATVPREQQLAKRRKYASMVTYLDAQLGRVLAALDARGVRDHTLIVYHTDHGIMLGDHGLRLKATLYRQVLNANLVIDLPDALWPERRRQYRRPVEMLDAVQTVLHAAGVPAGERARFEGESLLPALTDAVPGRFGRRYAFAQLGAATAVISEDWKYIDHATRPVLFDRINDPWERVNVAGDPANAGIVAEHRAALAALYERTGPPLTSCDAYPEPRAIGLDGLRYLPPPRYAGLFGRYASLTKYRDSCKIFWARLTRNAEDGGDAQAWCAAQGASLADDDAARRLIAHLNGNGKQAVLDRAGWPRDGRVAFLGQGRGGYRRLVLWTGSEFALGSYLGARGYPLCVVRE